MVLRWVSRITGVSNNLVQSDPGFLESAEKLRLGAELFLGISQQAKNGGADDDENSDRNHQLHHRKT
jgi:hypothetical protein